VPTVATPEVAKFLRSTLKGRLIAWDPVAREPRWTVEHGNAWNGGVLSTAGGLVFQGKLNGDFVAYDAATGDKLWSRNVKSGAGAGPGTYMIDGEQYVTIATGWGSAFALSAGFAYDEKVPSTVGKIVTFKLGGTGEIPDADLPAIDRTPKAEPFGTEAQLAEGVVDYARNCAVCHGPLAVSSGVLPDLRWSAISANPDSWKGVVLEGHYSANGMVSFSDYLSEDDVEAIRAYVLAQAHAAAAADDSGE
jgi:mono/diheme cytochrome c family protein